MGTDELQENSVLPFKAPRATDFLHFFPRIFWFNLQNLFRWVVFLEACFICTANDDMRVRSKDKKSGATTNKY